MALSRKRAHPYPKLNFRLGLQFSQQPQNLLILERSADHLHSQWKPLCVLAVGIHHPVGDVVLGVVGHGLSVLLRPLGDGCNAGREVEEVPRHIGNDSREEGAKDSTRWGRQEHGWAKESIHTSSVELSKIILWKVENDISRWKNVPMITLKISNVELTLTNKFLWFIASVREVAVSYTSSTEGTLGRVCRIVVSF